MKVQQINGSILPKGNYIIGDPSYIIEPTCLNVLLDQTNMLVHARNTGLFTIDRDKIACFMTELGDGIYFDFDDNEYRADSGLIGCIPVKISEISYSAGIHMFTFDEDFKCYIDDPHTLVFGHVRIDTDLSSLMRRLGYDNEPPEEK